MKVRVKTPARLHLGLIDLNGDLGRLFGGLGIAIDHPNVVLEVEPSEKLIVTGEEKELVNLLANRFFDTYQTKTKAHVNVKETIPAHTGLGSGTQLALAVATALARTCNVQAPTQELAIAMGRAMRTGVGTAVFMQGGFVVDGGKQIKGSLCSTKFPPLIFRQPFPLDWRFVVAIPNVKKGLANEEEMSAFSQLPRVSSDSAGRICRLTMLKLLPALIDCDITDFGEALTEIQRITGECFSHVQGGTYSSQASADCIAFMQNIGVHGVGQSSWGPALYGLVKKEDANMIRAKVQAHLKEGIGGKVFIAKPNNTGARIKFINPQKDTS